MKRRKRATTGIAAALAWVEANRGKTFCAALRQDLARQISQAADVAPGRLLPLLDTVCGSVGDVFQEMLVHMIQRWLGTLQEGCDYSPLSARVHANIPQEALIRYASPDPVNGRWVLGLLILDGPEQGLRMKVSMLPRKARYVMRTALGVRAAYGDDSPVLCTLAGMRVVCGLCGTRVPVPLKWFDLPAKLRNHNRHLRRIRRELCPLNKEAACITCPRGRDTCPRALYEQELEEGVCILCRKTRRTTPTGICLSCQMDLATGKVRMTPVLAADVSSAS